MMRWETGPAKHGSTLKQGARISITLNDVRFLRQRCEQGRSQLPTYAQSCCPLAKISYADGHGCPFGGQPPAKQEQNRHLSPVDQK
jgi:hypothetical protein